MLSVSFIEILLLPVYVVILYLLIRQYHKRYNNPEHRIFFMTGFFVKIFFGIVFAFFSIYLLPGDTEMYFTGGLDFKKIILSDSGNLRFIFGSAKEFGEYYEVNNYRPENYGYVSAASNLMPIKFVALFSTITFNSYLLTTLFFTVFSFFGLWFLFKTFARLYPSLQKAIFVCFFFIPSVLFWGGGIAKDPLCLGFLGIGIYNSYLFFFEKRFKFRILLAFFFSFLFLYITKYYIAAAVIPSFLFWYWLFYIKKVENKVLKLALIITPVFIFLVSLFFVQYDEIIAENSVETISENIMETQKNYIRATPDDGALLDYGEIVPTPAGLAKLLPKALVAALFRPFLWEARKLTSIFAAIEGSLLFCFTLYVFLRKGIFSSLRTIASDTTILFCFVFSIIFATAIGLNCFNLGTLVRYKIPCLPFFVLSLVLILKNQSASSHKTPQNGSHHR